VTRHPDKLLQRGASTGAGDGIRMAESLGAALVDMGNFYGHPLCRDAFRNPQLTPYPFLDGLVTAGIVVDAYGRRFADEGEGGVFVTNMIARLDDPLSAHVIFDETIWSGPGTHGAIPPNPHVPRVGGTVISSPTISGLAEKIGVDPVALAATVSDYSRAVAAKTQAQLVPPRRTDKYAALPIVNAPFHAIPLCAGITYTMGGIAIDGSGRVLRPDGSVIDGVYAAGTTTGGVEGGPNAGYVGGLVTSGATALAAAEHIAEHRLNQTGKA
jgi:fumarate reductase flavoprotein subunit